jgi:Bacterial extracellular solute-binding proteins, family 5 Middle
MAGSRVMRESPSQNSLASVIPDLAIAWSWDETNTALTFRLRNGVRWHDGKPFTGRDPRGDVATGIFAIHAAALGRLASLVVVPARYVFQSTPCATGDMFIIQRRAHQRISTTTMEANDIWRPNTLGVEMRGAVT